MYLSGKETHPVRMAVLEALEGGRELPLTALAHEAPQGTSLSALHYHVCVLVDSGRVGFAGDDMSVPPIYRLT